VTAIVAAAIVAAAIVAAVTVPGTKKQSGPAAAGPGRGGHTLSAAPASYLGLYAPGAPDSYTGVAAFTAATGVKPTLVPYYSGWFEPFRARFARAVSDNGAVPLVQLDPDGVSIAAIASGRYDGYLRTYAQAVRAYRRPVIVSFGHEMNGDWYPWGYKKTSPAVFVAAWRHVVTVFRGQAAGNVTWLWTVNITDDPHYGKIPGPASWWPGSSYVTWVGIDGYYYHSATAFSSLFGPTIVAVRELTRDPILIAETAALPSADQPAKLNDLFDGVRSYGLLGFVWFDVAHPGGDWQLRSPAALAAFRAGARSYRRP
jgi:mannan endo-1,4-beta-mannosidase